MGDNLKEHLGKALGFSAQKHGMDGDHQQYVLVDSNNIIWTNGFPLSPMGGVYSVYYSESDVFESMQPVGRMINWLLNILTSNGNHVRLRTDNSGKHPIVYANLRNSDGDHLATGQGDSVEDAIGWLLVNSVELKVPMGDLKL